MTNRILLFIICLHLTVYSFAQIHCNTLGQNPGTAFPVCGTGSFSIQQVDACGGNTVAAPCPSNGVPYTDVNPYWYKFTCFESGTLSFTITPNQLSDDYDWQLFDITGKSADAVYSDNSTFVGCNWSGETGVTGTGPGGNIINCGGTGVPRFSKMPALIKGHNYLLLVSHFTSDNQSGYTLVFIGGTASITDSVPPKLQSAKAACNGASIGIKLNKKMKCSSLAANGSDFVISPAVASIAGASGVGCSAGFDMDSVVITFANNLPPGNYTLKVQNGIDGNNLLDYCDKQLAADDSLNVTVYPVHSTPMDSLAPVGCAPDELNIIFEDKIECSSIASDGSDFVLTGNSGVSIVSAYGLCDIEEMTNTVRIKLSAPVYNISNNLLTLKKGSDDNTVINECGVETPAGAAISFATKDTVSAIIEYTTQTSCINDKILYSSNSDNGVDKWIWLFDNDIKAMAKDTSIIYTTTGNKLVMLTVSNGICTDTTSQVIFLPEKINASFENTSLLCPNDPATFIDHSTGPVTGWRWLFGNGNISVQQNPAVVYYPYTNIITDVPVKLIVNDAAGCKDTAVNYIKVVNNCYIAVPKAFSPNNDGLNDYLYPANAYKATNLFFRIYNRNGQLVFETHDWNLKWDGSFKGNPQDAGAYVWVLMYTDATGKRINQKGTTILLR